MLHSPPTGYLLVRTPCSLIIVPFYGFTQRSYNLEWIDTHALLVRVVTMICSSHLNVMQKAGWWGLLGGWPLLFRAVFLCLPNLAYCISYMLSYRFNIVLSLIQFFALYDSNKDFTHNYYCGFSWIVRFGDPVDQWSEQFWAFYWASRGYAGLTVMIFREMPVNDLKKVGFCTYRVWLCILHSACRLQLCKSFP